MPNEICDSCDAECVFSKKPRNLLAYPLLNLDNDIHCDELSSSEENGVARGIGAKTSSAVASGKGIPKVVKASIAMCTVAKVLPMPTITIVPLLQASSSAIWKQSKSQAKDRSARKRDAEP